MKDVQCYELFGGIALKNHAFSFFMSGEFHRDHKTVTELRLILPPTVLGMLTDLEQWCLSVYVIICHTSISIVFHFTHLKRY